MGHPVGGRIRLLDKEGKKLVPVAYGGDESPAPATWPVGECIVGEAVRDNEIKYIDDVQNYDGFKNALKTVKDPEYREYLKDIGSEVAVPLKVGDRIIGAFNVHSPKKDAFKNNLEILSALAGLAAIAIETDRLLNALQNVISEFTPSTQEKDILALIPSIVCDLMNFPACSIWEPDKDNKQELVIVASYGLKKNYVYKARISIKDKITGEAFRTKIPVPVLNASTDPRMKYPNKIKEMGYVSLLSVPMVVRDDVIGTINIYTSAQHNFTEYEKRLLERFGSQAGIIINSATLNGKKREIIKSILKIAFEDYELDQLLDEIVEIGRRALNAKSCVIFLLDDDKETLRIRAGVGEIGKNLMELNARYYVPDRKPFEGPEERKKRVDKNCIKNMKEYDWKTRKDLVEDGKLPMGITAYVVRANDREGKEILLPYGGEGVRDHCEWLGGYEAEQGEACTSIVEIPLIFGKKAEGVIKIENHIENKLFTNEYKEILSILADSLVLAIEMVRSKAPSYKDMFGIKLLDEFKSSR